MWRKCIVCLRRLDAYRRATQQPTHLRKRIPPESDPYTLGRQRGSIVQHPHGCSIRQNTCRTASTSHDPCILRWPHLRRVPAIHNNRPTWAKPYQPTQTTQECQVVGVDRPHAMRRPTTTTWGTISPNARATTTTRRPTQRNIQRYGLARQHNQLSEGTMVEPTTESHCQVPHL